ncbi:DUF5372 family protein, partial [Sinorhizobium psoraleae]|uniref:DUF5372 family protein n=1 Tax=Sinorhizobium psoraleae TaxID=520838 RepID=UPI00289BD358
MESKITNCSPGLERRARSKGRFATLKRVEFEGTHPFHPWRGQRFVLSTRKQNWGEDRVMFYVSAVSAPLDRLYFEAGRA